MVWTLNKFDPAPGPARRGSRCPARSRCSASPTWRAAAATSRCTWPASSSPIARCARAAKCCRVQDAATWFAQLIMFLLLGLLATPHKLLDVFWPALGVAAFLMFVARPIAVAACLLPFRYRPAEIGFIAWTGLRGAVGIFLASIPLLTGLPNATLYFNVAFVVVFVSLRRAGLDAGARRALVRRRGAARGSEHAPHPARPARPARIRHGRLSHRARQRGVARRCPARPRAPGDGGARRPRAAARRRGQRWHANDYAYFLAPTGQAPRLDWLFAEGSDARVAEQDLFGSFTLPGDVPLGETRRVLQPQHPGALLRDHRVAVVRRALRRATAGRRPARAGQGGAAGRARGEGRTRGAGGAEVHRRGRALDSAGADHPACAARLFRLGSNSDVVIVSARRPNPHTASGPST